MGILQIEGALARLGADHPEILHRQRREQLELGVAAAPLAVAVATVGV